MAVTKAIKAAWREFWRELRYQRRARNYPNFPF